MICPLETRETTALLLAYSSSGLEAETAIQVRRHLEVCPACSQFVAEQAAVWAALDLWQAEPVSADFDQRLYRRIEEQVSWWDRLLRPLRPLLVHQGLPVAATAGVLLMATVLLNRQPVGPVVPLQESAQVEALQPDQVEHALDEVEMLTQFNHLMRSEAADSNEKM